MGTLSKAILKCRSKLHLKCCVTKNMCISFFCCTKRHSKWLLQRDRDHVKKDEWKGHRKRSSIWNSRRSTVAAMVNLSGFYLTVLFLRRLRQRAASLSPRPSRVTWRFRKGLGKKKLYASSFSSCRAQRTKRKREYSWSYCESESDLWATSLRVTVLALFYESVKKGTQTNEVETTTTKTTNWTNEIKPQTRQKLT